MKRWLFALPFILGASAAMADDAPGPQQPEYLTREQVLTLPSQELARRMLQGAALNFVEVSRPDPSDRTAVERVEFATAPWELVPGLCLAIVLDASLEHPLYAKPYDNQPSARAGWFSTETVYKIVSSAPRKERARPGKESRSACLAAGPVFRRDGNVGFFRVRYADRENNLTTAYDVLRTVVTDAYAKDTRLECNPLPPEGGGTKVCSDIPALLRSLNLSDLTEISYEPCRDRLGQYCIEGMIYRKPISHPIQFWALNIRVRLKNAGNVPADVDHVDSIAINDGWGLYH